jgi:hypothetical protein
MTVTVCAVWHVVHLPASVCPLALSVHPSNVRLFRPIPADRLSPSISIRPSNRPQPTIGLTIVVLPRSTLYSPYMAIFQFIWPDLVRTVATLGLTRSDCPSVHPSVPSPYLLL